MINYLLPETFDPNGDAFELEVNVLPAYMTYNSITKSISIDASKVTSA
jgi:hypothetical protein